METKKIQSICIFCGSKVPKSEEYVLKTKELAQEMLKRSIDLVYGGGTLG
jgi:predicted Rossmann-fold nucleotide-binding protein